VQSEFHELDRVLVEHGLSPASLLETVPDILSLASEGRGLAVDRLKALLERDDELDDALGAWSRAGIWALGERDKSYPLRLRQRLTAARPPLLFGAGDKGCLNGGGVCIVGSRDSPRTALRFSATLGDRCAREGLTVISSDMRGVDREAVSSTLGGGGRAIVVLSDRLEKAVTAKRYRDALAERRLTMITPFSPDARFSVANAMRVNRYQYALSDVAVIVETRRTGGIWSGADENRNEKWVPAFVRTDGTMSPGNLALFHLGLLPISIADVENNESLSDFFVARAIKNEDSPKPSRAPADNKTPLSDLYSVFMAEFEKFTVSGSRTEEEIMGHFGIERAQARKWLKRAMRDGRVERSGEAPRYSVKR